MSVIVGGRKRLGVVEKDVKARGEAESDTWKGSHELVKKFKVADRDKNRVGCPDAKRTDDGADRGLRCEGDSKQARPALVDAFEAERPARAHDIKVLGLRQVAITVDEGEELILVCRFCESFGSDGKAPTTSLVDDAHPKHVSPNDVWTFPGASFCKGDVQRHLYLYHKNEYEMYQDLLHSREPQEIEVFFEDSRRGKCFSPDDPDLTKHKAGGAALAAQECARQVPAREAKTRALTRISDAKSRLERAKHECDSGHETRDPTPHAHVCAGAEGYTLALPGAKEGDASIGRRKPPKKPDSDALVVPKGNVHPKLDEVHTTKVVESPHPPGHGALNEEEQRESIEQSKPCQPPAKTETQHPEKTKPISMTALTEALTELQYDTDWHTSTCTLKALATGQLSLSHGLHHVIFSTPCTTCQTVEQETRPKMTCTIRSLLDQPNCGDDFALRSIGGALRCKKCGKRVYVQGMCQGRLSVVQSTTQTHPHCLKCQVLQKCIYACAQASSVCVHCVDCGRTANHYGRSFKSSVPDQKSAKPLGHAANK
ncbi:hypothetical protein FVE85_8681 [Porphyridium purpureum]|uniref:Uncharacterized protein n=1 Tax=Porphyridium purpureum TaxID=35688 RepID=A0A5J4YPH9_PORPP|nr:hypothetical protein FVE85_8681 [Porphyridium purpureum]|eukprot:POR5477..scf296_7